MTEDDWADAARDFAVESLIIARETFAATAEAWELDQ